MLSVHHLFLQPFCQELAGSSVVPPGTLPVCTYQRAMYQEKRPWGFSRGIPRLPKCLVINWCPNVGCGGRDFHLVLYTPSTWPVNLTQYVICCASSSPARVEGQLWWKKDYRIRSWLLQWHSGAVGRRGTFQKIGLISSDDILLETKFQHDLKISGEHKITVRGEDQEASCKRNGWSFAVSIETM